MTRPLVGVLLCCATVVAGCAHHLVPPPASETVQLGTLEVTYRDWSHLSACDVDSRNVLQDAAATDAFLAHYLESTSAGPEGHWSQEQLRMLEQSPNVIPKVAHAQQKVLADLRKCPPEPAADYTDVDRQGSELARQALLRVAEVPGLLAELKARRELETWKDEQTRERATARASNCPHHVRPGKAAPPIYYAVVDEDGRSTWLFCDDVHVTLEEGGKEAKVVSPPERSKKGAPDTAYLEAAKAAPAELLRRSPQLPGRKKHEAPKEEPEPSID